jgi:hypothetical protein
LRTLCGSFLSTGLYLAYKGKTLSEQEARLWEHVIAEDFAELSA